ncbi:MAG: histidine--tRNA ligase [Trebonia sp.]|uniref:histidine--tRNA ligase n=1 Tax=Trebonia sp. TaxID=2767075 RepID=UPI003CA38362
MAFQAPKGVSEYVPPRSALFEEAREAFATSARRACYGAVETAVFEDTALFVRGVGESSDVVSKEMYSFADRGGREITLRPEFTAGVLRSLLEHNLHKGALPVKVWTSGPAFRYERPQAGRYRQFYQFDLEAIGTEDPAVDAETIAVAWDAYQSLGLRQYTLLLNSLGDKTCRPVYREALQKFLRALDLDEETRQRIEINPLRVLDDKRPDVRAQLANAPVMTDYLCAECKAHYDTVRALLDDLGIPFTDAPRLVRGLDYYTRTTYEFDHALLGAQSGIGGGGRYDGLSEDIGGPPLPGIGFAVGLDRIVLAMEAERAAAGTETTPVACQVFGVPLGAEAHADVLTLMTNLRRAGVNADMAFGARGLKGALRAADRSGAAFAVLIGAEERRAGTVSIKDLKTGDQQDVAAAQATDWLIERLGTQ